MRVRVVVMRALRVVPRACLKHGVFGRLDRGSGRFVAFWVVFWVLKPAVDGVYGGLGILGGENNVLTIFRSHVFRSIPIRQRRLDTSAPDL